MNDPTVPQVNITKGVTIHGFWAAVAKVFQVELKTVEPDEWLRVFETSLQAGDEEMHPLFPVADTHRADGGMLGLERVSEWERGSDEEVLSCLTMSLVWLKERSGVFGRWIGGE
jgi:hypothetical protein